MKKRCYNEKSTSYRFYGAKGIRVCDEWKDDFLSFFNHVGKAPDGYSIDRIDSKKNYEPGNVRWSDSKTQTENRSAQVFYEHEGISMTLPDWSKKLGINYRTLNSRIKRTGMSFSEALAHVFGDITNSGMMKIKNAVSESNKRRAGKELK